MSRLYYAKFNGERGVPRPAPSSGSTVPLLPVVVRGASSPLSEGGPMRVARGWPHDPGEFGSGYLAGGPMTLAIGWSHEGGENRRCWPHEGGDWQSFLANVAALLVDRESSWTFR
jgi:hypothetical protein